jgi:hypothetical protein
MAIEAITEDEFWFGGGVLGSDNKPQRRWMRDKPVAEHASESLCVLLMCSPPVSFFVLATRLLAGPTTRWMAVCPSLVSAYRIIISRRCRSRMPHMASRPRSTPSNSRVFSFTPKRMRTMNSTRSIVENQRSIIIVARDPQSHPAES